MDNFVNKLRIVTELSVEYTELVIQADLPDLEITQNNGEATIVLGSPPLLAPLLDEFTNLEWVQSTYAGVDALVDPLKRQDYQLTNVKGIFGEQISEYVLGYMIAHFRHFKDYKRQQSNKIWKPRRYKTLSTRQMMIFGTGAIGNHLARAASTFNVHTIGINRTGIPPKDSAFSEIVHIEQAISRLQTTDVIVSTLPNTPLTEKLFNAEFFAHCEETLFFNVGRGSSVDTDGLLRSIDAGNISHAFLDVFINEPISEQCPYWHNPNITVTPHIAAFSFPEQVVNIFKENYHRWRDGYSLNHTIDFDKGY
jgi:phosphoglycerate dehydrogenase-like enzyme